MDRDRAKHGLDVGQSTGFVHELSLPSGEGGGHFLDVSLQLGGGGAPDGQGYPQVSEGELNDGATQACEVESRSQLSKEANLFA